MYPFNFLRTDAPTYYEMTKKKKKLFTFCVDGVCRFFFNVYVDYVKIPVQHRIIYELYYIDRISMVQPLQSIREFDSYYYFFKPKIRLEVEGL